MKKNISNKQLKYYYYTALKHFIFLSNIHDVNNYIDVLLSEEFLNTIFILIKANGYTNIYDEDILRRIQYIANYIRSNEKIDKNKYIPLINEIIIDINGMLSNNKYGFNVDNLFLQEANNRIINGKSNKAIDKGLIASSIINDFVILDEHLFNYEDYDTFVNNSMKWLMNPMYYYSLNAILTECNDLFNNKLFVNNARTILDENDKISGQYSSYIYGKNLNDFDKKVVSKIRKIDKRIINKLYL